MVFKLVSAAAKTWRRLKGENQMGYSACRLPLPERKVPRFRLMVNVVGF
jgi:hypothetical protein